MQKKAIKIEHIPIAQLKPADWNPRQMAKKEMDDLKGSIKKFGLVEPIVARKKDNLIVGGHQRWLAAQELGIMHVPVVWLTGCTDKEAKILNVALNKIHGEWDQEKLAIVLGELSSFPDVDTDLTGFGANELSLVLGPKDGETDPDAVPELPKKATTKVGDLWVMGDHRLLCGDSTKADDVRRLMGDKKADLCLTDPPYSVGYKSRKEQTSAALDSYLDPSDAEGLLMGFLSVLPCSSVIMTYTDKQLHPYVRVCDKLGFETIDLLVWKKNNFCFWPGARYQQQHELIFMYRKKGAKFYSKTPGNASTVWEIPRPTRQNEHPTARPMSLWNKLVKYHTKKSHCIYDPFMGSGTTIIAAEQTGRVAAGLELSPYFVDTAIKRWEQFTGKKAKPDKS